MDKQKVSKFINLQIRANQSYQVYGEITTYLLTEITELGESLTPTEQVTAFSTFLGVVEENNEVFLAKLN